MLISRPAETAEARPPPTARMLTEANCAAPPKTRIDIAIAAQAPITGSASTPKDMPIARVGRTKGSAGLDSVGERERGVVTRRRDQVGV